MQPFIEQKKFHDSKSGNILQKIEMGLPGSDKLFIYRFPSSQWHTIVPLSDFVTYVETTSGPYVEKQTEFAPWAPNNDNSEEDIESFLKKLKNNI